MLTSFGFKAHSGWAALIVLGRENGNFGIVERRRVELVDEAWARQPYHAAETLGADAASELVERGIASVRKVASREMRALSTREHQRGNRIGACAVVVGDPMPQWSVAQILAVHVRMHRAEGVLFRDVLLHAARECGLRVLAPPEKTLMDQFAQAFGTTTADALAKLAALGKACGPPWGQDQKQAALAALLALNVD